MKSGFKKLIIVLVLALIVAGGVLGGINIVKAQPQGDGHTFTTGGSAPGQQGVLSPEATKLTSEPPSSDKITNFLAWIVYNVAWFFSWLVSLLIQVLVKVANYNNFLNLGIVNNGWRIVRDICNNFFIIMLLIISVGTILRLQNYSYRQLLPKLLIVAVLINFSKLFTGILIDFSQVFMLTFASTLQAAGGGVILQALGLSNLYQTSDQFSQSMNDDPAAGFGDVLLAVFFALIVSVVSAVVILVIIIVLLYRIVMLWFLIILSPAAYLLSAWPQGKGYSSQWWGELTKYLIAGPVMLFFVYLAFFSGSAVVTEGQGVNVGAGGLGLDSAPVVTTPAGSGEEVERVAGFSKMMSTEGVFNLIIVLGLLVGSLIMGQKIGGAGMSWAGTGMGFLKKAGKASTLGLGRKVGGKVGGLALGGARIAGIAPRLAIGALGRTTLGQTVGSVVGAVRRGQVRQASVAAGGGVVGATAGAAAMVGYLANIANLLREKRQENNNRMDAAAQADKGARINRNNEDHDWDDKLGAYIGVTSGNKLRDGDGNLESRFGNYKDNQGNVYRRRNESDNKYYKVNDKGDFIDGSGNIINDADLGSGKGLTAAKKVSGFGDVKAMSSFGQDLWTAWSNNRNKSWHAKDVAENEKIEKIQKDYDGMTSAMLGRLLDMETDSNKRMAISMTLAIKSGFKDAKQVNAAKDALSSNSVLLKSFNEKMNKKDMVLNNTRKDGTLDQNAVKRLIADGDAKWSEQKTSQLNKEALTVMADQLGPKFHSTLEDMMKTSKDKSNVQAALEQNLDSRGMTGADMSIRKSAAAISGNWNKSFTDSSGNINHKEMRNAMSKVSKAKVFSSVNDADLGSDDFAVNMASSLSIKAFNQMYRSDDMEPAKLQKYADAVQLVANMHDGDRTSTGQPVTKSEIDAAKNLLTQIRSTPGLGSFAP